MKLNKKDNTATYTRAETRTLLGRNDAERDELNRELRPLIQAMSDKNEKPVNVYFADGTMDGQVYPQ